ncbi:hypothetical protein H0A36_16725 [Endozoicomonas sp. SM1973]|uniref:Uncharacterized protein n=1 Tax=Spartinivicinus marinus TaxID=2994442 RepID=A0A853IAH9_9GAMM|nr:hypothetical protein [Spartinivicinus marinus]MCX4024966.1 hypothetical protein [Spartinivicinus marinus]NYZ67658.1 hypothetical protein [Spartinivicinus marinus]
MISVWLLLITIVIIGCMAIIVFNSAAKRYASNKQVTDCLQRNKYYDRRKNSKPIYYPFTDSEGNLVTSDRRNHKERRLTPYY